MCTVWHVSGEIMACSLSVFTQNRLWRASRKIVATREIVAQQLNKCQLLAKMKSCLNNLIIQLHYHTVAPLGTHNTGSASMQAEAKNAEQSCFCSNDSAEYKMLIMH